MSKNSIDEKWRLFNDSTVTVLDYNGYQLPVGKTPYVLFYERKEISENISNMDQCNLLTH